MIPDNSNRLPVNTKILKRFFSKIRIDPSITFNGTPCWLWTARIGYDGYGYFSFEGRDHTAQRISHGMFINRVAPDREVDHLCRVRECANPVHLEDVPPRINKLRGNSPIGKKSRQTHCIYGHEFTADNTYIRMIKGNPHRYCRQCSTAYSQSYIRKDSPEAIARKRAYNKEWQKRKRASHKLKGAA